MVRRRQNPEQFPAEPEQGPVRQTVKGQGKEPEHTHQAVTHSHDHWHLTHHHREGIEGVVGGSWDHESYWHTHEHNHAPLTHSHNYSREQEEQHHDSESHIHDHNRPATSETDCECRE